MLVTGCDSCHDEAACLESRERGDTFSSHVVSCVCKEGFVGDGQKCYDIKLCLNSSCCEEGYHWSAERGCVDTDECSLPDSPCKQHQVCQNTPGSFECLEPSPSTRSAPSSSSVQFSCGQSVCPSGMDCIRFNGNLRCADPCQNYAVLNDDWRSTNNTSTQNLHCDRNVNWQGWYRLFLWGKSAHIPERCVAENRCGTHAPLWITEPHPTRSDQIVNRTVCNAWSGSCCRFTSHDIHVKHCYGNYYVYKLVQPSGCSLAYCAEVNETAPIVSTTTSPPSTPATATNQVNITATTTANNSSVAEGQVHVNGGNNSCSGRVEIFHRGQWGTVLCDDSWDLRDANVVCRQLDCGPARSALQNAAFGQGSGPIWLDDVICLGNESSITECRHRGFGVHNCAHVEDASVICEEFNTTVVPTTPDPRPQNQTTAYVTADITATTTANNSSVAEGQVRVNGGNNSCSGRVEIFHRGQWGTVCDDSWGLLDAEVVCRQLGCGRVLSAPQAAAFGQGRGPIWMDDVSCRGSESELTECRHRGFGIHNCGHHEDASVVCEVSPTLHHQLICGPDKLQVGLNLAGLTSSGLNPVSGNFAARNCSRVRVFNNMVWYEVDAMEGACGNMLMTNRTHAIYSNRLFIYPLNNGSFSLPVSIPFSCAYPLETDSSLNVAIRPFLPASDGISGSGTKARAFMALYRTSAYTETYPAGRVSLPVGSPLYVGVTVVGRDRRFVLVLENCYATSSPSPNDPMQYPLIRNKCPADSQQVSVIESGRSFRARFSALLFLLQENYRDVFLHCNLSLCNTRNSCVPSCARRTYRSVSSSDVMEPLTIGPIVSD
uniref:uromodulin-like n=1 Tax=Semicossyphus pulcher TaxID=241346 RepID=UPI0037E8697A